MILFIKTTKPCSTRINKYTSTLKGLLFCGFSLKQKQFTPLILAPPITGYNLNRSVNQTETEFKSSNIYWVLLPTGDVFALIIGVSANPLWPFCLFYFIFTLCKKICVNLVYRSRHKFTRMSESHQDAKSHALSLYHSNKIYLSIIRTCIKNLIV